MAIFSKLFFVHLNPRLPLALTLALTLTNPSPTPCEDLAQKQNIETNCQIQFLVLDGVTFIHTTPELWLPLRL